MCRFSITSNEVHQGRNSAYVVPVFCFVYFCVIVILVNFILSLAFFQACLSLTFPHLPLPHCFRTPLLSTSHSLHPAISFVLCYIRVLFSSTFHYLHSSSFSCYDFFLSFHFVPNFCLYFLVSLLVVGGAALPLAGVVHARRADGAGRHEVSHCR